MDYSDTTVIIPVKNEPAAGRVAKEALEKLPGCKVLVIYKGDRKILNLDFENGNMRVVEQHGAGKGVAVRQALKLIDTAILCLIDGDATYDVDDLKTVIKKVREGADMATGNRFAKLDKDAMPFIVRFGNGILTDTANVLYGMSLKDSQTGLRAIRKESLSKIELQEPEFGIEEEMNIKFRKAGFKTEEVPISYHIRVGESQHMKLSGGIKLLLIDFKFLR